MKEGNPFVAITAVAGGIALSMFILPLFFAPTQLSLVYSVIWAPVVLGVVALFFTYKSMKR